MEQENENFIYDEAEPTTSENKETTKKTNNNFLWYGIIIGIILGFILFYSVSDRGIQNGISKLYSLRSDSQRIDKEKADLYKKISDLEKDRLENIKQAQQIKKEVLDKYNIIIN